jgi:hypothetical protein
MTENGKCATYRLRNCSPEEMSNYGCRRIALLDESTQQVMATCDRVARVTFARLTIVDHAAGEWLLQPNRKIMPSRWLLGNAEYSPLFQFDQKILGKLVNPLYKTALAVLTGPGSEIFRLVDPRTNIPDRILGSGPIDWVLLKGEEPVAKVSRLARQDLPRKGLLGKLSGRFWKTADQALVSAGREHVLPAPAVLAMLLLLKELTDTSGG